MNLNDRERKSADAYLTFLQSKGTSTKMLYLRSHFLDLLIENLNHKSHIREAYAVALKSTIPSLPKADQDQALTISREYFPFWMRDIKAIAEFEKKYGFNVHTSDWDPQPKSLKTLEHAVQTDVYTINEEQVLSRYLEKISKAINDFSIIKERSHLAKVLLMRLRDAPEKNDDFYRTAVDLTLPLYPKKSMKQLYLDVARDFYSAWKNTPETFA